MSFDQDFMFAQSWHRLLASEIGGLAIMHYKVSEDSGGPWSELMPDNELVKYSHTCNLFHDPI